MDASDCFPTLDRALSDPLIRMVMAADRVDPAELDALLRSVARARAAASEPGPARGEAP